MDYQTHCERVLAHYTALAREPGWKAYVWHQINAMARECPALYAALPQQVTKALTHPPEKIDVL